MPTGFGAPVELFDQRQQTSHVGGIFHQHHGFLRIKAGSGSRIAQERFQLRHQLFGCDVFQRDQPGFNIRIRLEHLLFLRNFGNRPNMHDLIFHLAVRTGHLQNLFKKRPYLPGSHTGLERHGDGAGHSRIENIIELQWRGKGRNHIAKCGRIEVDRHFYILTFPFLAFREQLLEEGIHIFRSIRCFYRRYITGNIGYRFQRFGGILHNLYHVFFQ